MENEMDIDENCSNLDLLSCSSKDIKINNNNHKSFSIESDISSIEDIEKYKTSPKNIELLDFYDNNNNELLLDESKNPKRKKRNKEDLNTTPLPLFSCIYCSNETVAFQHLSNTLLSDKYLYCYNKYNSDKYDKIINNKYSLVINDHINTDNNIIEKLIIEHTDNIKSFYNIEYINYYFTSLKFKNLSNLSHTNYTKNFLDKIENYITKRKNEIDLLLQLTKKTSNNNSNNQNKIIINSTNSIINNFNHLNSYLNLEINKENNNSSINFNSLSLNNIDTNYTSNVTNNTTNLNVNANLKNNIINQLNSIGLDSIEENKDNNSESERDQESFFNFFKFDLRKKISKNDINWDKNYFNIWEPNFCDE